VWLVVALVACGDNNTTPRGSFTVVGHSDLGARGMNGGLAIAGQTAYIGSRNDRRGIAILDLTDPADPLLVGEIGPPFEVYPGRSSPELRAVADANQLIVVHRNCDAQQGCQLGFAGEGLDVYDIASRTRPIYVGNYFVPSTVSIQRHPKEMFVYSDPSDRSRILAYLSTPPGPPSFEMVDLTNPSAPVESINGGYDAVFGGDVPRDPDNSPDYTLSSVAASDDGRLAYFSYQTAGLFLVNLAQVIDGDVSPRASLITPVANIVDWAPPGLGPHAAVNVPGRPLLVVTEEILPVSSGDNGCPWGHVRTVDISDPTTPYVVGEFALPENDPEACSQRPANAAFTSRAATATENLALVSWYAGGLQAIDLSDPSHPQQLAEFRPAPAAKVDAEDPVLGGVPVEVWSYPVIDNGLIYVVDVRNGLYVLRYEGWHAEEISERRFLEGNSNIGAYTPRD